MKRRAHAPLKNDPLTERALSWLVHLHSGSETAQDWYDYHDWKMAHSSHAEAAARAEHVWSRLGPALKPPHRMARRAAATLAVCLVLAGGGVIAVGTLPGWFADQATGLGEIRTVALDDGSSVVMDSDTRFDIHFSASQRRIRLLDGQIFVTVSADPARPFIVEAGEGEVQALGTAFNIRQDSTQTAVSVTEHAVRVSLKPSAPVDVTEGHGVDYDPATGLAPPHIVDVENVTAWRRGEILFDGRPLGVVAAEMGRYRRGAILFTDERLKQLPVTGMFSTRDVDDFFGALERTLPVRVLRLPYLTLIRPRAD